jgi:hypothetical protein
MVTKSSDLVHQCGRYEVVMKTRLKAEISRWVYSIHYDQTVISSPVNIYIQEEKVVISFHLHGELNVLVDTVQMVEEVSQPVRPLGAR